ncbi:hypothetical protein GCM10023321_38190 [Pseudonocardia eucalypti]|uniref:DUF2087 domain-containing protein n=1 Tax=Pseudonocardia eucalypti TaxID=648755 RepID=A0ABP9Q8I3_9PSEU|nr:hypothetical protein [Pseudonocardia eucalypti]
MNAAELLGLLAEPERLRVLAALVLGARSRTEVVEATGLAPRSVATALNRLHGGGLVEESPSGLMPRLEVFSEAAREARQEQSPSTRVEESHGYADPDVERLVRTFVSGGRLVGLPAHRARRRIVLEHLATIFQPGVRYREREVNVLLRAWTQNGPVDYVTLRRYLVDESLLDREDGEYWRSGGWVDV